MNHVQEPHQEKILSLGHLKIPIRRLRGLRHPRGLMPTTKVPVRSKVPVRCLKKFVVWIVNAVVVVKAVVTVVADPAVGSRRNCHLTPQAD